MRGSLFDRITRGHIDPQIDEDESIRLHLIRMFTARQGSVQSLPDYGLPDLNDLTLSRAELISTTCLAIQKCIESYEPRLMCIKVTHRQTEQSTVNFSIEVNITAKKKGIFGSNSLWDYTISLDGNKVQGRQ